MCKNQYICEGGVGGEACIEVQLRREFPGIGGVLYTYQSLAVALRKEESGTSGCGHRAFLRHAFIKTLEDYFLIKDVYGYAHITNPLGSTAEGYIYEWAFGIEGFSWDFVEGDGRKSPIQLEEWEQFISAFTGAGIEMDIDCTNPDNGRISQNVVHQLAMPYTSHRKLNQMWKRIDFGERSIKFDYDRLERYLADNQETKATLKGRFDFLQMALRYLTGNLKAGEEKRFEQLTLAYRSSTLSQLSPGGFGKDTALPWLSTEVYRRPEVSVDILSSYQ